MTSVTILFPQRPSSTSLTILRQLLPQSVTAGNITVWRWRLQIVTNPILHAVGGLATAILNAQAL
jgi:hypothetical protein